MAEFKNTDVNDTGAINIPVGTSAQRPGEPGQPAARQGMIRYNTDESIVEFYAADDNDPYDSSNWETLGGNPAPTSLTYLDTFFKYMGQDNSANMTGTIPSTAQAGDLIIAFYATDTPNNQTTPSGWTLVGNGNDSEYPKSYYYAKICGASDPGSTLTVSASSSLSYCVAISVFRPNAPLTAFQSYNFVNSKGPSSYNNTISSSGVSGLCVAFSGLTGRTGPQTPTLGMSINDAIVVNGGGAPGSYAPSIGYKIYTATGGPANINLSTNDTGRQSLSGFYISVT